MLITCPQCATSYRVDSVALGAGRSVRCARCQTSWFATANTEPAVAPAPAMAGVTNSTNEQEVAAFRQELGDAADASAASWNDPAPSTVIDAVPEPAGEIPSEDGAQPFPTEGDLSTTQTIVLADPPSLAPDEGIEAEPEADIETVAARRRGRNKSRTHRRWKPKPLTLVTAGLAAVLVALVVGRQTVVSHAPQMASLYAAVGLAVNLRGLAFEDVATTRVSHDGVPVLVVEGNIINARTGAAEIPRLRFAVRDESGAEVYSWTAQPPKSVVEAGASLPFRSRLASPPDEAHSVAVRFFHRRDALAEKH